MSYPIRTIEQVLEVYENPIQIQQKINQEIHYLFQKIDVDGDGQISREELSKYLMEIGQNVTERQVSAIFNQVDKNKDGKIQKEEFCQFYKLQNPYGFVRREVSQEELERAFNKINSSSNDVISLRQLEQFCGKQAPSYTKKELKQMFTEIDSDKNGYIDLQQFISFYQGVEPLESEAAESVFEINAYQE